MMFSTFFQQSSKKPDDIVTIRIDDENHQEDKAYRGRSFEEFVAWFTACHHFPDKEQHMTAV